MSVPGYLSRLQLGLQSLPARRTVDSLLVEPLQCHADDDYFGIGPDPQSVQFNPDPPTYAMKFCPVPGSTHVLGLANEDGRLALQDTSKVNPKLPMIGLTAHNNAIFDFAWRPDSASSLVTVAGDQRAALWDLGTGGLVPVSRFKCYTRSVKCVEWRPSNNCQFATGARDNNIVMWDVRERGDKPDNIIRGAHATRRQKTTTSPSPANCSVTSLVWLDENNLVSTGDNDGLVKVWDMRKNYGMYKREPMARMVIGHPGTSSTQGYTSILLDPTRCYVYVSCMDDTIYKLDIVNGKNRPEATFTGASIKNFFIKSSLSPCGRYLASGSSDHRAVIWATASPGGPVARLGPHEAEVTCVSWQPSPGWCLATATDDVRHRLWRLGRESDTRLVRGEATMTGKPDIPVSPVKTMSTPSRPFTTPTTRGKTPGTVTPSITRFFTPPSTAARLTPVSERSRASKRRLADSLSDIENNTPCSKSARLMETTLTAMRGEDVLLSSPVKCTFSPTTYKSPSKSTVSSEIRNASPRFLGSPLKQNLESPLAKCPRPLLCDRTPLALLQSPTANLPNLVADGTSPHHRPVRVTPHKADWLTTYAKQRKKEVVGKQTTPKSTGKKGAKKRVITVDKN